MYLFIFESIGTQELILIGIVALVFLGPRRMPEMARKMGKLMSDFRNTTNEFKSTWEREVNFEEEDRAMRTGDLPPAPVARTTNLTEQLEPAAAPEIRAIEPEEVKAMLNPPSDIVVEAENAEPQAENQDKRDWL